MATKAKHDCDDVLLGLVPGEHDNTEGTFRRPDQEVEMGLQDSNQNFVHL